MDEKGDTSSPSPVIVWRKYAPLGNSGVTCSRVVGGKGGLELGVGWRILVCSRNHPAP